MKKKILLALLLVGIIPCFAWGESKQRQSTQSNNAANKFHPALYCMSDICLHFTIDQLLEKNLSYVIDKKRGNRALDFVRSGEYFNPSPPSDTTSVEYTLQELLRSDLDQLVIATRGYSISGLTRQEILELFLVPEDTQMLTLLRKGQVFCQPQIWDIDFTSESGRATKIKLAPIVTRNGQNIVRVVRLERNYSMDSYAQVEDLVAQLKVKYPGIVNMASPGMDLPFSATYVVMGMSVSVYLSSPDWFDKAKLFRRGRTLIQPPNSIARLNTPHELQQLEREYYQQTGCQQPINLD